MDKPLANLNNALVQQLLKATSGGSSAAAGAGVGASQASAARLLDVAGQALQHQATQAQLSLPPALRQLLTQHGQVHQLLPQLTALSAAMRMPGPAETASAPGASSSVSSSVQLLTQLLPSLRAQLATSAETLTATQLRHIVSQWFAAHPQRALTTPIGASSTATATAGSLPTLLPSLLQWLLVHRAGHAGLTQLLQQGLAGQGNAPSSGAASFTPAALSTAALNGFANTIQGGLQDIRLSQIHLADTSAALQPEYYLVIPYQQDDKAFALEWLLRKEARKVAQQVQDSWHFTLRVQTQRFGPLLVKGCYLRHSEASQERPNTAEQTSSGGILGGRITTLRFYLSESKSEQRDAFATTLTHLQQRLQRAGLEAATAEVHVGHVPETLAPGASQLQRSQTSSKGGPYGR